MRRIAPLQDAAARRRCVKTLADFPGQTHIARVALAVASRQIDADGITPDVTVCIGNGDVAATAAERNHQLDLELEIGGEGRIWHPRPIRYHRVTGFLEEERRITLVGLLHLADVVEVVAADAIDAADRKSPRAPPTHFRCRNFQQLL